MRCRSSSYLSFGLPVPNGDLATDLAPHASRMGGKIMNWNELAKFFAGVAANQVLTHGAFAVSGAQFDIFGISYTQQLNTAAVVVWAVVLALLVYCAWVRK